MNSINDPPRLLKGSAGIDSIYLQFKGVNKSDVDRFCEDLGLSYKGTGWRKHTREWTIFLAGGQPITVVYHFSSKTTTFQIGKLMNYSKIMDDQHRFLQKLMQYFHDRPMKISGLHFAIDVKEPISVLTLNSNLKLTSEKHIGSTVYLNRPNKTVMTMYDKGTQMEIFSTTLTRFELRLSTAQQAQLRMKRRLL